MKLPADGQPVVLKEWAVIIKALLEGSQIMIMRKGGIREETRDFRLLSDSFYLFPTYEHQRRELLKEEHRRELDDTLAEWSDGQTAVTLRAYAEVAHDIEVTDKETLDRLRSFHIWTDDFAEERLRWKKTKPLHLLLLRVYRLDRPETVPLREEYNGCKSWVRLENEGPAGTAVPVLTDEVFRREVDKIFEALRG